MGAISVVNAIACGKGTTLAVKLPTRAKVVIDERRGRWRTSLNGRKTRSPLMVESVRRAIRVLGRDPSGYSGAIEVSVSAPLGVGLKTSSSSSVAAVLATFSAFGRNSFEERDVLGCSTSASLVAGVSVTGALDDAASCLLGGVNFADNSKGRLLLSARLGRRMAVLVRVPRVKSRRAMVSPRYVRRFSKVAESIFAAGREGMIWKAMVLNGLLYSSIYGYPSTDALQALGADAVGAGLSGTGPAVAAVFDREGDSERLRPIWTKGNAEVIRTETSDGGARIVV